MCWWRKQPQLFVCMLDPPVGGYIHMHARVCTRTRVYRRKQRNTREHQQSQLVYKAVNGLSPDYMCALFTPISNISTGTTRSNERGDLYVSKARSNVFKNTIGTHIMN